MPGVSPLALARSTSRSVTMPTAVLPSTTTTEPTRWSCIRRTAVWRGSVAVAVTGGEVMRVAIEVMVSSLIAAGNEINVDYRQAVILSV